MPDANQSTYSDINPTNALVKIISTIRMTHTYWQCVLRKNRIFIRQTVEFTKMQQLKYLEKQQKQQQSHHWQHSFPNHHELLKKQQTIVLYEKLKNKQSCFLIFTPGNKNFQISFC